MDGVCQENEMDGVCLENEMDGACLENEMDGACLEDGPRIDNKSCGEMDTTEWKKKTRSLTN